MGWDQGVLCFGGQRWNGAQDIRAQTHWAISSHCFSFSCCSASRSCSTLARFIITELRSARDRVVSQGGQGQWGWDRSSPHITHPYLCPGVSWPLSAAPAELLCPAGSSRSSPAGRMSVETWCLFWGALPHGVFSHQGVPQITLSVPQTPHRTERRHPCTSSLA